MIRYLTSRGLQFSSTESWQLWPQLRRQVSPDATSIGPRSCTCNQTYALQTLRVIGVDRSACVWTHTRCCACPALTTALTPFRNCTTSSTSGAITSRGGPRKFALNESQSLISVFRPVALMGCRVTAVAAIRI
jgi:hypothetical protein